MKYITDAKGKDKEMDYFFLYSDMLLCTKRAGAAQYKFIRKIPLKNALLEKKVPMPKGGFYILSTNDFFGVEGRGGRRACKQIFSSP